MALAAELGPIDAKALRQRLVAAEQSRRVASRTAKERARELKQAEIQRRREWESELVGTDALPSMLGAPKRLVEKWLAEGLIPVARTTTTRRGGQIVEELDFPSGADRGAAAGGGRLEGALAGAGAAAGG